MLLIDNSLSVVNRTGAYHIAKDICEEFRAGFADVRYWRLGSLAPQGLFRKVAARMMIAEYRWLGATNRFLIRDGLRKSDTRLFLDPLYTLRSVLSENDVVLCHDIGPLTHKHLYDSHIVKSYELAYRKIRKCKPGIVFVSDWSKHQFMSLFGTDFAFLKTIPLYLRNELFDGSAEAVPDIVQPFFLSVGAIETRKNQICALRAYQLGEFHREGISYIICGPRGAGSQEVIEAAKSTPGVHLLGYVSDRQLRWLYRNAEAFLLPSLLEGFGMPALEAAYAGLLPIVSANSALVEAVQGMCLQVPPNDIEAISQAMRQALLRTPEERRQTGRNLREMASTMTKDRFLCEWKALLLPNGSVEIDNSGQDTAIGIPDIENRCI